MKHLQFLDDTHVGLDPRIEDTMNEIVFLGEDEKVAVAFDPKVNYIQVTDMRNGKRLKLYLQ